MNKTNFSATQAEERVVHKIKASIRGQTLKIDELQAAAVHQVRA